MYPKRQYCIDKFSEIFSLCKENILIINLEKGIFNETIQYCKDNNFELKWSNNNFLKKYSQIARKIIANTTYTPNAQSVIDNILNNIWKPENIAKMTHEELYPEKHAEVKEKVMSKYINTKKSEQEHDGFFKCRKCKSKKTTYTQAQTRSADEPMTTFVVCLNCENRWKF